VVVEALELVGNVDLLMIIMDLTVVVNQEALVEFLLDT
jgi:hypothetical protein